MAAERIIKDENDFNLLDFCSLGGESERLAGAVRPQMKRLRVLYREI
jgi:hypothetical protein